MEIFCAVIILIIIVVICHDQNELLFQNIRLQYILVILLCKPELL